jgi:hypothetical protein
MQVQELLHNEGSTVFNTPESIGVSYRNDPERLLNCTAQNNGPTIVCADNGVPWVLVFRAPGQWPTFSGGGVVRTWIREFRAPDGWWSSLSAVRGAAATVTVAVSVAVWPATLVAVTWKLSGPENPALGV